MKKILIILGILMFSWLVRFFHFCSSFFRNRMKSHVFFSRSQKYKIFKTVVITNMINMMHNSHNKFLYLKRLVFALIILQITVMSSSIAMCANQWVNGDTDFIDGDAVDFNDVDTEFTNYIIDPLQRYLLDAETRISLIWASSSTLTATAGSVVCENSAGTLIETRRNTSATTITWSDIDTGSETNAAHYVYANCDADAITATFKISLSASKPDSVTLYKQIGGFTNTSGDIDRKSIAAPAYVAPPSDSTGKPLITAIYSYASSASSFTEITSGTKKAYGSISIAGDSTQAITNLPFTSSSTYSCSATWSGSVSWDDGYAGAVMDSGSQMTLTNQQASTRTVNWICEGY